MTISAGGADAKISPMEYCAEAARTLHHGIVARPIRDEDLFLTLWTTGYERHEFGSPWTSKNPFSLTRIDAESY